MNAPVRPALSQASLERQIAREGKRWGLVPETGRDGKTRVCEVVPHAESRFGVGEVVWRGDRRICTVNDEAPFHEALRNRIGNGETDLARRYKLLEDQEAKEQADLEAAQFAETLALYRSRNRITMLPNGTVIPAGLANRRRR